MEQHRRHSKRRRETCIKRGELKLLVEQGNEQHVDREDRSDRPEGLDSEIPPEELQPVQRDISDLAVQHSIDVDMHLRRKSGDDDDADRKEEGEDQTDRGVLLDQPCPPDPTHQHDGEDPDGARAEDHRQGSSRTRDGEDSHDPEQDAVTDRVAHERKAAEHQKGADKAA